MTWKNETGKKIFADAYGNAVEEGSPYAAEIIVEAGGTLKDADARKYGLLPPASSSASASASTSEPAQDVSQGEQPQPQADAEAGVPGEVAAP